MDSNTRIQNEEERTTTIERNKQIIIDLIRATNRRGNEETIHYLNKTDFFTAPCSTINHLNIPGGLAQHSINVYSTLKKIVWDYDADKEGIQLDSVIICGLLHDICKANFYKKAENENKYRVEDELPLGHGEKSVIILSQIIELKPIEQIAIRWHMNAYEPGIHFGYPTGYSFNNAIKISKLVPLLFIADYLSTQIIEREIKEDN